MCISIHFLASREFQSLVHREVHVHFFLLFSLNENYFLCCIMLINAFGAFLNVGVQE